MKRLLIVILVCIGLLFSNNLTVIYAEENELTPIEKEAFDLIQKHYLWDDINLELCKKYISVLKKYPLKAISKIPEESQICLDEFSQWTTPNKHALDVSSRIGSFAGVGIVLKKENKKIVVMQLIKGGSSKGFLQVGDIILKAREDDEKEAVVIKNMMDAVKEIRGVIDTKVFITIERKGKIVEIGPMIRTKIKINHVNHKKIDNDIGYIQIKQFGTEFTADDFEVPLKGFKEQRMSGIVVDIRDNPGGLVFPVLESLYYFSKNPYDIMIIERFKNIERIHTIGSLTGRFYHPATNQKKFPGQYSNFKIVVLINKRSASGSDMFAGTMKDWGQSHGRYVVMGQASYGKGVGQSVFTLSDGSGLSITTFEFLVGNSKTPIHKKGVTPDYIVKDSRLNSDDTATSKDLQFMKALEWLRTGKVKTEKDPNVKSRLRLKDIGTKNNKDQKNQIGP